MTSTNIALSPLSYNGSLIHSREEMLSLTDMWKAAGAQESKDPKYWRRQDAAAAFTEALALAENVSVDHLFRIGRGRGASTFAHWQVALAYAKYLSPEFHMWCNTVVRERMEGKSVSTASLSPEVLEMIRRADGVSRATIHKVTGIESTVQALAAAVSAIASVVQPPAGAIHRTGKTAGQIWRDHGFPRMRVTSWFSNRLCEMGCQIDGCGRGELGLHTAKLFDPDKADLWLRNGGRKLVEDYITQRRGQKVLRLVPPVNMPEGHIST